MSAFVVGDDHIRYLLEAGLAWARPHGPLRWYSLGTADRPPHYLGELRPDTADAVGTMLLRENVASVDARYPDAAGDGVPTYVHRRGLAPYVDPVKVLKALDCYEYQASEHADWYESEARAFCAALRKVAIGRLPGYDEAPWCVTVADLEEPSPRRADR